jgi:hypothetical protein
MLLVLSFANGADAQTYRSSAVVDAGTNIVVRTNESIDTNDSDGRVYLGVVEQDVMDRNRRVAIPRGSDVEMIVRESSNKELVLDLDSVMVNGLRYGVASEQNIVTSEQQKEGLGANKRTGKYVGGGAVLGAIVGAIAGGGKGAAIGAGAGAAAGAGAQVLTRGGKVKVPAESLLTFRLAEPLRAGVSDNGYLNNGAHYHPGYSSVYDQQQVSNTNRQKAGAYTTAEGSITIGTDRNIRWNAADNNATVYVQVDNNPEQLFASGKSGVQQAPWIEDGHVYVFMLRDGNGNEIARDRQNTRRGFRR